MRTTELARRLRPGEFIGESSSRRIAGAILSVVRHSGPRQVAEHTHEWPYISTLLRGNYQQTVGAQTIFFEPFTAVFHGAGLRHTDSIGGVGARFFLIELGEVWWDTIQEFGGRPRHAHELHGEGASWPALQLYRKFSVADFSDAAAEELLFEICSYLPTGPVPAHGEPPWMQKVDAELFATFRATYSLRTLAHHVSVNPAHLARTYRTFRRRTIGDTVNRLRVQEACRQLVEPDRPLEAIARDCGFSDQSHMTRAIRRLAGGTPAELRRTLL